MCILVWTIQQLHKPQPEHEPCHKPQHKQPQPQFVHSVFLTVLHTILHIRTFFREAFTVSFRLSSVTSHRILIIVTNNNTQMSQQSCERNPSPSRHGEGWRCKWDSEIGFVKLLGQCTLFFRFFDVTVVVCAQRHTFSSCDPSDPSSAICALSAV